MRMKIILCMNIYFERQMIYAVNINWHLIKHSFLVLMLLWLVSYALLALGLESCWVLSFTQHSRIVATAELVEILDTAL